MARVNHTPTAIVIGGGAAGFFGAINLARQSPQTQVVLLEAGTKFLSKVRISGGGRCNVTHHCFDPAQLVQNYPRGGKALRGAFSRFQPQDVIAWFGAEGVTLKTEGDGRMFPVTDDSATIVDCLINAARQAGVVLRAQTPVREVVKRDQHFLVTLKSGETLNGDRLLIATGSNPLGYRWAEQLGHTIQKPVPSLFTFNLGDRALPTLAGVSVPNARVSLDPKGKGNLSHQGPVLITHWGLSGPAVLKLSAWGARLLHDCRYHHPLWINWLPDLSLDQLTAQLQTIKTTHPRKQISNFTTISVPKRLWHYFVKQANIAETQVWADFSKKQQQHLSQLLLNSQYTITGKGVFKEEFVTCGGVNLKEINFKTLESRCCPGLYFAGEILDVDGVTGGFNFQNAWTTSYLAAAACAESLVDG
jgi:predicted Rossmann fold flavoprotein